MTGYPPLAAMNIDYRFYGLESFFASVARIGFTKAELWTGSMHLYVDAASHDPVDGVKALSKRYGVEIVGICPEQNNPKPWNIAARGDAARARTEAYFRNVIDAACLLEAPQVLVTAGWAFLDEPASVAWDRSVRMLRSLSRYAAQRGIRLVMEALQRSESTLVNTAFDVRRMLDDVGEANLLCCLDTGAMVRAGDTIDGYFDVLGDRVAHVHLVDVNDANTHLAWGDGERSLRDDLQCLARHGYGGVCTAETYDSRYFADPVLADERTMAAYRQATEG